MLITRCAPVTAAISPIMIRGRGRPQADPYSVSLSSDKASPAVGQRSYAMAQASMDGMDVRAQLRAALE